MIEMKIRLSLPRTTSITTRVASAAQAVGSARRVSNSCMSARDSWSCGSAWHAAVLANSIHRRDAELIGLLEELRLVRGDGEFGRLGGRCELVEIGGADDGRGHVG